MGYFEKIRALRFISGVVDQSLIGIYITKYKRTYIKIYAISIIVRFNYLHGARSASGELIGRLVKVSLG